MSVVTKRDGQGVPQAVVLTEPREIALWGAISAAEKLRGNGAHNGITLVELKMNRAGGNFCVLWSADHVLAESWSKRSLREAIDGAVAAWKTPQHQHQPCG